MPLYSFLRNSNFKFNFSDYKFELELCVILLIIILFLIQSNVKSSDIFNYEMSVELNSLQIIIQHQDKL